MRFCQNQLSNLPFLGERVLESSKLHIQNLRYNIMQPYFKKNFQLNYRDTDSLIYTIRKQNVYDFMKKYSKYQNPYLKYKN